MRMSVGTGFMLHKHLLKISIHPEMRALYFWLTRNPDEMFVWLPDLYSLKGFIATTWLYVLKPQKQPHI